MFVSRFSIANDETFYFEYAVHINRSLKSYSVNNATEKERKNYITQLWNDDDDDDDNSNKHTQRIYYAVNGHDSKCKSLYSARAHTR